MPELPEVEAARRALEAHCVGRRIADDPKIVVAGAGVTHVAFERAMVGRTIVAARRRGKNLWIRPRRPALPVLPVRYYLRPETVPPISELGSDALFEPMSVDKFVDYLIGNKIGIKALLLDQARGAEQKSGGEEEATYFGKARL